MENLILVDTSIVIVTYDHRLNKVRLEQYGRIINDFPQINTLFLKFFVKDERSEQIAEINRMMGVNNVSFNTIKSAKSSFHSIPTDTMLASNDAIYREMNLYNSWDITKGDPRIKIAVIDSGCDMQHPDINAHSGRIIIDGIESTNKGYPLKINIGDILAQNIFNGGVFEGWLAFKYEPEIFLKKTWGELSELTPSVFYSDSTCKNALNTGSNYPNTSMYMGDVWINEPFCLYYTDEGGSFWLGTFGRTDMWDCWGHGTAICGLISSPHNGNGFAGIAPDCTTVAYKFTNDAYVMSVVNVIAAVIAAVDDGNHILSCSWGGPAGEYAVGGWNVADPNALQILSNVFTYATNKGCVPVVAAGNMGHYWNTDSDADVLDYPAAFPNCIAVGACGWTDYTVANTDGNMDMPLTKLDFARLSSFGQKYPQVDIVAPGYGWIFHAPTDYSLMWLPYPWNSHSRFYTYQGDGGTSFSCPAVAAGIALCMSRYLDKYNITDEIILTNSITWDVGNWLTAGAKLPVKLSNGLPATKGFGKGRFDVYNALVSV